MPVLYLGQVTEAESCQICRATLPLHLEINDIPVFQVPARVNQGRFELAASDEDRDLHLLPAQHVTFRVVDAQGQCVLQRQPGGMQSEPRDIPVRPFFPSSIRCLQIHQGLVGFSFDASDPHLVKYECHLGDGLSRLERLDRDHLGSP